MGKTIAQLTALAATPDDTDNLIIDDGGVTKKITASNLKGDCIRSEKNNALSSSTGTKIGTATNQLIGFWNATPVDQPALTADLLDSLQEVGLVASGAGNTPLNLSGGAVACGSVTCSGTAGLGYATGAGGAVTQATNKSTGVTLNAPTGRITMNGAALNANTTVSFTLTNSAIASTDLLVLNHVSAGTAGSYALNAQCASGTASINVRNITAGNLSEAIVIGFAVIKSVTS